MLPTSPLASQSAAILEYRVRADCPYELEPLIEAVDFPCGHTVNEPAVYELGGRTASSEQKRERERRVVLVTAVQCPICRKPAKEFLRNWSLRDVIAVVNPLIKRLENPPAAAPKPRNRLIQLSLKERFLIGTGTALSLLGSTFAAYNLSEVRTTRTGLGSLFGYGELQYDTSARDNNMFIAFFSSAIATLTLAGMGAYIVLRKMQN